MTRKTRDWCGGMRAGLPFRCMNRPQEIGKSYEDVVVVYVL